MYRAPGKNLSLEGDTAREATDNIHKGIVELDVFTVRFSFTRAAEKKSSSHISNHKFHLRVIAAENARVTGRSENSV